MENYSLEDVLNSLRYFIIDNYNSPPDDFIVNYPDEIAIEPSGVVIVKTSVGACYTFDNFDGAAEYIGNFLETIP
jgi:hypothetical protein